MKTVSVILHRTRRILFALGFSVLPRIEARVYKGVVLLNRIPDPPVAGSCVSWYRAALC